MASTRCNRNQIMDAAERLFGERGYGNVTIGQLCVASGLPVGSIYHHFGSKAGVLKAVLRRGTAEFFASMPSADAAAGSPVERLAAYHAVAGELIAGRLQLFRLLASLQLQQADGEVQAILREENARAITGVVAFIEPVAVSAGVPDAAECARELAALNMVFTTGLVTCVESTGIDVRTAIRSHLNRLVVASVLDRAAAASAGR